MLPKGMKAMDEDVFVNAVIEEWTDDQGRNIKKTQWRKLNAPLSLGSMREPKNKILQLQISDNSKPKLKDMISGLGEMFK